MLRIAIRYLSLGINHVKENGLWIKINITQSDSALKLQITCLSMMYSLPPWSQSISFKAGSLPFCLIPPPASNVNICDDLSISSYIETVFIEFCMSSCDLLITSLAT